MSEEQIVGERRRRREAERAAQQAAGAEQERPLTRREIRAREAALQTGELKIDETGEFQVVRDPVPAPEPDAHLDGPATGMIGMTRRQLRELREQQAAAASSETSATTKVEPTPSAPVPPVRRPVVRPPAAAGSVRSLTEDGAALAPAAPREQTPSDPSSPATWSAGAAASVDVTGSLPAIVADPGPLPTTRRTMRVAEASVEPAAAEAPSEPVVPATLDELIAGETEEPEPFDAKPSWPELPPATPAAPMAAVLDAERPVDRATPPAEGNTEVIDIPAEPPAAEVAAGPAPEAPVEDPVRDGGADHADEHDDEDEHDDHRTPRWLTALMWLVLVVIGIVLGLLIWQLVRGEGSAAAGAAIWQGVTMTQGTAR